jgi:serine/threonine protein kinase
MNHNLQREKKGADLLGELGLEHAEITGVGNVKGKIKLTDGTFVESDKIPCMTKDYIGEGKKIEGQFLDKLMKSNDPTVMSAGGKLSDEVQSAIVEYLNTANKKGVLLGDFKPDNIYLKKEGGRWKVGVADTDGIAKIADPAKARELQIAQLTSELGPIKHPGFVRGEIARYTEAASVGGFENLIDEKFINMLKNGDVLDNVAQNKAIREIQNNPGAVLQGDALNKVQAAQKVVDEAIKKVEASQSSAMNIARELLEESKKKGGFISKQGLPDPGDLDIPANLLGGPADGGFIDFGFDISSIGPADIAVSRMAA